MAEDLAQEALLRGYAGLRTLSEPEKFGSWLHGIAIRACLDWLKAKERTQVTFSDLGAGGSGSAEAAFAGPDPASPSSRIEKEDDVRQLLAEVEALPEEYRTVIMLYYYDDVTYRDIAGMLGVSAATVNLRLTKARALLRRRLSASGR
jgi:RNA polymerase sigma-70 factor (ECF subfamily)